MELKGRFTFWTKVFVGLLCLSQMACSLGPSAANRSYKAYDAGEYRESIRLVTRALSTYEYDASEIANLLFLKAQGYAKLNYHTDALGVLMYILKNYPDTEAAFRGKALMAQIEKALKRAPSRPKSVKPPDSKAANVSI